MAVVISIKKGCHEDLDQLALTYSVMKSLLESLKQACLMSYFSNGRGKMETLVEKAYRKSLVGIMASMTAQKMQVMPSIWTSNHSEKSTLTNDLKWVGDTFETKENNFLFSCLLSAVLLNDPRIVYGRSKICQNSVKVVICGSRVEAVRRTVKCLAAFHSHKPTATVTRQTRTQRYTGF